jgi:hypothetical protein
MQLKSTETCYMCELEKTSREHVPPRCLFPEKKDFGTNYFRENLITVPSCEKHNSEKSHDDEFLMICLSGIVGNNQIAYFLHITKVQRALDRRSPDFLDVIYGYPERKVINDYEGNMQQVMIASPDNERLRTCFRNISFGLYFHHYGKRFMGDIDIFLGFLDYSDGLDETKVIYIQMAEKKLEGFENNGANPKIFQYKFGEMDSCGVQIMKMTFYQGVSVYVSFIGEKSKFKKSLEGNN